MSSSDLSAGQRFTLHCRILEVRPGRINKKLDLNYDYNVKGDDTKLQIFSVFVFDVL